MAQLELGTIFFNITSVPLVANEKVEKPVAAKRISATLFKLPLDKFMKSALQLRNDRGSLLFDKNTATDHILHMIQAGNLSLGDAEGMIVTISEDHFEAICMKDSIYYLRTFSREDKRIQQWIEEQILDEGL